MKKGCNKPGTDLYFQQVQFSGGHRGSCGQQAARLSGEMHEQSG